MNFANSAAECLSRPASADFSHPFRDECDRLASLWRGRAVLFFFPAGPEKLLQLAGELWAQFFQSSEVLVGVGSSPHLCIKHAPIFIGLGQVRFEFDGLIVVLQRFRIVLRALLPEGES